MRRLSRLAIYTASCTLAGLFVSAAIVLRPLRGYDTPQYERVYWCTATIALTAMAVYFIRFVLARGGSARRVLVRVARWPMAAPTALGAVAITLVTAFMGTYPYYAWMTSTGSGGTALYSKVEADALAFIWRPVLHRMRSDVSFSLILALVALTWACAGALAGIAAMPRLRRYRVSLLTVVLVTAAAMWCLRVVLVALWPLVMPW